MNKIAYLIGAGASANALPIIKNIPDRIQNLIGLLESRKYKLSSEDKFDRYIKFASESKNHYQNKLIEDLKWLKTKSSDHASIDTFAKKLFIRGKGEELRKLKIALSVFFVFEQVVNKVDKRYDTFFASILNKNVLSLPDNIKIISWNYDYQFELSFSEYSNNTDIQNSSSRLMLIKKNTKKIEGKDESFRIYKLNGTIDFISRFQGEQMYASNLNVIFDLELVDKVIKNYVAVSYVEEDRYNLIPNLSFSWEEELLGHNEGSTIVDLTIRGTSNAVALVIIGYSFPFFNRDIDRKIIGSMKNLKSVYLQDINPDIIEQRFRAIKDDVSEINFIQISDTEQFYLPNEL